MKMQIRNKLRKSPVPIQKNAMGGKHDKQKTDKANQSSFTGYLRNASLRLRQFSKGSSFGSSSSTGQKTSGYVDVSLTQSASTSSNEEKTNSIEQTKVRDQATQTNLTTSLDCGTQTYMRDSSAIPTQDVGTQVDLRDVASDRSSPGKYQFSLDLEEVKTAIRETKAAALAKERQAQIQAHNKRISAVVSKLKQQKELLIPKRNAHKKMLRKNNLENDETQLKLMKYIDEIDGKIMFLSAPSEDGDCAVKNNLAEDEAKATLSMGKVLNQLEAQLIKFGLLETEEPSEINDALPVAEPNKEVEEKRNEEDEGEGDEEDDGEFDEESLLVHAEELEEQIRLEMFPEEQTEEVKDDTKDGAGQVLKQSSRQKYLELKKKWHKARDNHAHRKYFFKRGVRDFLQKEKKGRTRKTAEENDLDLLHKEKETIHNLIEVEGELRTAYKAALEDGMDLDSESYEEVLASEGQATVDMEDTLAVEQVREMKPHGFINILQWRDDLPDDPKDFDNTEVEVRFTEPSFDLAPVPFDVEYKHRARGFRREFIDRVALEGYDKAPTIFPSEEEPELARDPGWILNALNALDAVQY